MTTSFDIIGDIHGHAEKLASLLRTLGYQEVEGTFRHSNRKVVFLGDFIDRGPEIRRVLQIVRGMVDSGSAFAVMGNHEFNALAFHSRDENGDWLRPHTEKNIHQHEATLMQVSEPFPDEWQTWLDWFRKLPLSLDFGSCRIAHAGWSEEAVSFYKRISITPSLLAKMLSKGTVENKHKETLLNGVEVKLPDEYQYHDEEGTQRSRIRTRWWMGLSGRTYREVALPGVSVDDIAISDELVAEWGNRYPVDAPPLFLGHYWFPADERPVPIATNVACLDYSVARGGPLVAYRFDGETTLSADKMVWV